MFINFRDFKPFYKYRLCTRVPQFSVIKLHFIICGKHWLNFANLMGKYDMQMIIENLVVI